MVRILIGTLLIVSTTTFGQSPTQPLTPSISLPANRPDTSTALRVVYTDRPSHRQPVAWFLNGERIHYSMLDALSPDLIDSTNVVKTPVQLDGVLYDGQVYVKTKSSYTPKLISLADLKKKYTRLGSEPTLFLVGSSYVNEDYDTYRVDENSLAALMVSTVINDRENIHLHVIKLITKEEQKRQKPTGIRLRGGEIGQVD